MSDDSSVYSQSAPGGQLLFEPAIKNDPEAQLVIRTWIQALREGRYQQGQGRLRNPNTGGRGGWSYCCLGVLCDLLDPQGWQGQSSLWVDKAVPYLPRMPENHMAQGVLSNSVVQRLHLTYTGGKVRIRRDEVERIRSLAELNDSAFPFSFIADAIERDLEEALR